MEGSPRTPVSSLLPRKHTFPPAWWGFPVLADAGRGRQGPTCACVGRGGGGRWEPPWSSPLVSQELQLKAAQNENARLVEENSRLSGRATEKEKVEALPRSCQGPVPGQGTASASSCHRLRLVVGPQNGAEGRAPEEAVSLLSSDSTASVVVLMCLHMSVVEVNTWCLLLSV